MQYDINFLNIGNSQIVDKGTTIKLPCNVDMYPGRLQITTLYKRSGTRVCQQKYNIIRNKRENQGVLLIDFREQKSNFYLISLLKSLKIQLQVTLQC